MNLCLKTQKRVLGSSVGAYDEMASKLLEQPLIPLISHKPLHVPCTPCTPYTPYTRALAYIHPYTLVYSLYPGIGGIREPSLSSIIITLRKLYITSHSFLEPQNSFLKNTGFESF